MGLNPSILDLAKTYQTGVTQTLRGSRSVLMSNMWRADITDADPGRPMEGGGMY